METDDFNDLDRDRRPPSGHTPASPDAPRRSPTHEDAGSHAPASIEAHSNISPDASHIADNGVGLRSPDPSLTPPDPGPRLPDPGFSLADIAEQSPRAESGESPSAPSPSLSPPNEGGTRAADLDGVPELNGDPAVEPVYGFEPSPNGDPSVSPDPGLDADARLASSSDVGPDPALNGNPVHTPDPGSDSDPSRNGAPARPSQLHAVSPPGTPRDGTDERGEPGLDRDDDTEWEGAPGLTPPASRSHSGQFLTDVVVELGYVTRERMDSVIEEARTSGRSPESLMRGEGMLSADQLSRAIAERYGLDHIDLGVYQMDMGAANLVAVGTARRDKAIPVGFADPDTLLIAVADPTNVLVVDGIQMMTGLNCRVAVAVPEDLEELIGRLATLQSAVSEAIEEDGEGADEQPGASEVTEMRESADDAPVIKLVYSVLGKAVAEGASDIHFEPQGTEMRIRFRIDGVLYEAAHVPKRMVAGVVSRMKIMSDLDIAEKRIPQDGRVSIKLDDRKIDLRVTTLPTQRGEGCTVRILDEAEALRPLRELGLEGEAREKVESAFRQAYGAVLVTGPTGSGKSTTLYAALNDLNSTEKKIITIEDPVEYRLPGINQINVNRKAGLDFARGLRSILRADPDIIMVGEIRDAETARVGIEAALTGHMVLSTLHTNDAPGAILRLQKMGIESFLTASAVDCVVAQRLARKLCPDCKRGTVMPRAALAEAGIQVGTDLEVYEPVGCTRCRGSGYRGRGGIFSVMAMSERIKEMTVLGAPEGEIARVATEEGMLSLREDGLSKVRAGVTSIEEVARVSA